MEDKARKRGVAAEALASRVFYPYLFALFPVVSLLSSNAGKVSLHLAAIPLLLSLSVTAILALSLRPILPEANRRGAVLLFAVVLFWTFGSIVGLVRRFIEPAAEFSVAQKAIFVVATALLTLYAVARIRKSKRSFAPLTRFLNPVSTAAIAVAVASLALHSLRASAGPGALEMGSLSTPGGNRPNIVYIILDAYTRGDVLKEAFNLDNGPFEDALEERGFFMADNSYAKNNLTSYSLASTLNMQLLDGVALRLGGDALPESLLRDSLVIKQLGEWGYRTVIFRSDLTEMLRGKVDSFVEPNRVIHAFHERLINATPLRLLVNRLNTRKQEEHGRRALIYDIHRDGVREKFEILEALEFGETPHFVFAHILSPHWPFVFDAKGEAVYPTVRYRLEVNFPSWEGPTLEEFTEGYAEQLQAVNAMTLRALDGLLEKNPNTIVILQGDHGTRRSMHAETPFSLEKRAREEHAILNAFRFPEGDPPATIKRTITSVNTFRVLFDELFGANLGLLDPKFFMFDPTEDEVDHDVTEVIKRAMGR